MKLRVRNKFILGFSPLLAMMVILGVFGIRAFLSIDRLFVNLQQHIAPSSLAMLEFKDVLATLDTGINTKGLDRQKIEAQVARLQALVRQHLGHADNNDAPTEKTAHDIRYHATKIIGLARYLMNLTGHGWQDAEELSTIHANIRQEQIALGILIDQALAFHLQDLAKAQTIISDKYRHGSIIIWSAITLGVLIALYMIFYLVRTVLTPIAVLREGAKQIGNGALDYDLTITTGDEFEELADEFKAMARKLKDSYSQLDRKILARTQELSQAITYLKKEIGERMRAEEEQKKAEAQVHLLTQELLKVQEIERKRIALDLHDNVAQELSALKVMSETLFADPVTDTAQLQRKASEWAEVLRHSIGTVRELSYNLWPSSLEQMGIKTALAGYCRDFAQKNGIQVNFTSAGMERLSMALDYDIAINIYRLVQEALNNIKRHAAATQAQVKLVASGASIVLHIDDNGQGFDHDEVRQRALAEKRFGLLGMQERVRLLSGSIKISSRPMAGTRIFIEIPWDTTDDHQKNDCDC